MISSAIVAIELMDAGSFLKHLCSVKNSPLLINGWISSGYGGDLVPRPRMSDEVGRRCTEKSGASPVNIAGNDFSGWPKRLMFIRFSFHLQFGWNYAKGSAEGGRKIICTK